VVQNDPKILSKETPKMMKTPQESDPPLPKEPLSEPFELQNEEVTLESDAMPERINILPQLEPPRSPDGLQLPKEPLNTANKELIIKSDAMP
jgi:hypothetical protein